MFWVEYHHNFVGNIKHSPTLNLNFVDDLTDLALMLLKHELNFTVFFF